MLILQAKHTLFPEPGWQVLSLIGQSRLKLLLVLMGCTVPSKSPNLSEIPELPNTRQARKDGFVVAADRTAAIFLPIARDWRSAGERRPGVPPQPHFPGVQRNLQAQHFQHLVRLGRQIAQCSLDVGNMVQPQQADRKVAQARQRARQRSSS